MITTYTIGEMAQRVHRTVRTLQKWDVDGKLKAFRTATGRRYYTHQQLLRFLGLEPESSKKEIVAYCRVSSSSQKADLKNQLETLQAYCAARGYCNVDFISEIGGGLNFKRKKFLELLDRIEKGLISKLVLAHKDRLVRFGFDYFKDFCEKHNCEIELLNNSQLSPEEEMVQDLMTIIHCFSSRLYGLRNYKKTLKEALNEPNA